MLVHGRDADRIESRQRIIQEISDWAQTYYPDRRFPFPLDPGNKYAAIHLEEAEIVSLFSQTTSRQAHLALVDQAVIRDRLGSQIIRAAVDASWSRSGWTRRESPGNVPEAESES